VAASLSLPRKGERGQIRTRCESERLALKPDRPERF
jgi:hypothetical protein